MLGEFIFPEQSKTSANDFVTRVASEKQCLHSSQQLSWSLRMGWQVVSTTIFEWLLNLWLKMWMLGKFIFPEQSKTKANDFVMGVANKKQHLHSSQQLPWSLRMGWQVVSTTIFEWLLNLWLKMWTNYRVAVVDNLLERRTNRASKRLASLALGS